MVKEIKDFMQKSGLVVEINGSASFIKFSVSYKNCSNKNIKFCCERHYKDNEPDSPSPIYPDVSNPIIDPSNKSMPSKIIIFACPKSIKEMPKDWSVKLNCHLHD